MLCKTYGIFASKNFRSKCVKHTSLQAAHALFVKTMNDHVNTQ